MSRYERPKDKANWNNADWLMYKLEGDNTMPLEKVTEILDVMCEQAEQIGAYKNSFSALRVEIRRLLPDLKKERLNTYQTLHRYVIPTLQSFLDDTKDKSNKRYEELEAENQRLKEEKERYGEIYINNCRIVEKGFHSTLFDEGEVICDGDFDEYLQAIVDVAITRADEVRAHLNKAGSSPFGAAQPQEGQNHEMDKR